MWSELAPAQDAREFKIFNAAIASALIIADSKINGTVHLDQEAVNYNNQFL